MKKNILITSACVATLAGGFLLSPTASAADDFDDTKETKGTASFSKSTNNEVLKPDEKGEDPVIIIPDTDVKTNGPVALTHVPAISFGTGELNPNGNEEYSSEYEGVKKKGDTTATAYEMPIFVQVADNSGKIGTPWNVTVKQKDVFKSTTVSSLKNTRIRFYGQTLTDSYRTTNVAGIVSGITIPTGLFKEIPVPADTGNLEVLRSKQGSSTATSTNGAKNSVVFKSDYVEANDFKAKAATGFSKNNDVRLHVPYSDGAQALAYEAVLEWTISYTV